MKITMLGTGHAVVTKCYNTCFVVEDKGRKLLVDGGGGSYLLNQLEQAVIAWQDLRQIFVTHKHTDHIMGIIWMIRLISHGMSGGKYQGDAYIYGHEEVIGIIRDICKMLLQEKETKFIDDRIHMVVVEDGDCHEIIGNQTEFFDIHSTKAKQFGFCMHYGEGHKLTCCGDEPYNEHDKAYVENSDWLMHEAFCLHAEADRYHPYEKHHSTVKDASELATELHVKNLLLYHTEDDHYENRKELYYEEGRQYFYGNLLIPDDLDVIEIETTDVMNTMDASDATDAIDTVDEVK